jgi:hypothetical protein
LRASRPDITLTERGWASRATEWIPAAAGGPGNRTSGTFPEDLRRSSGRAHALPQHGSVIAPDRPIIVIRAISAFWIEVYYINMTKSVLAGFRDVKLRYYIIKTDG